MLSIDELMQGKAPGEIKVNRKNGGWFQPFYRTEAHDTGALWYGIRQNGRSDCFVASSDGWELWQEPATIPICKLCERYQQERNEIAQVLLDVRCKLNNMHLGEK